MSTTQMPLRPSEEHTPVFGPNRTTAEKRPGLRLHSGAVPRVDRRRHAGLGLGPHLAERGACRRLLCVDRDRGGGRVLLGEPGTDLVPAPHDMGDQLGVSPTCARHGVRSGQVDISARLIWIFEKLAGFWTFAGRHRNVWPA